MKRYFADLHIHIGRSEDGSPIKITAARDLTLANILEESLTRKGITLIGIVDSGSPKIQKDIEGLIESQSLTPLDSGGLCYKGKATLLLGAEVETREASGGHAHFICYFPYLDHMVRFTGVLKKYIKNVNLSSQKARLRGKQLLDIVEEIGGILIPAHVFTPHKSIFGSCAAKMTEVFGPTDIQKILAVELGLSSDSYMADRIAELASLTFLTNSDAHSLPKIGREYNIIEMAEPNYAEFLKALKREKGRGVVANYGLDPRLGKYHRTSCLLCHCITSSKPPVYRCENCGSTKIVKGVLDRIEEIADYEEAITPGHRPEYHYQVPLSFVPGVGRKTVDKLLNNFGNEMEILHSVSEKELVKIVGGKIASMICLARAGQAELNVGGGGCYGKMVSKEE